jgi:hypothetical protein
MVWTSNYLAAVCNNNQPYPKWFTWVQSRGVQGNSWGGGLGGLYFMHTGVTDGVVNSPTPLAKFFYVPNQKLSDASSKCPVLGKLTNFRLL